MINFYGDNAIAYHLPRLHIASATHEALISRREFMSYYKVGQGYYEIPALKIGGPVVQLG